MFGAHRADRAETRGGEISFQPWARCEEILTTLQAVDYAQLERVCGTQDVQLVKMLTENVKANRGSPLLLPRPPGAWR